MGKTPTPDTEPTTIKKYANRRLYHTGTSSYVTLEDLYDMVKNGEDFIVKDAKTGEDLTRSVLTQIIFEQEAKGTNLLPVNFLKQVIGFYGGKMQGFVPHYLENTMESFTRNQDEIHKYFSESMGSYNLPLQQFEQLSKQNIDIFRKTMEAFTPFGLGGKDKKK